MNEPKSQFIAVCPECATILKVSFNKLGQNVRCSHCQHTFIAGEAIEAAGQRSGERPAMSAREAAPQVERIDAVCPGCQATLHVRRAYIGNEVRCKYCDEVFRVRDPNESEPKAAPIESPNGPKPLQTDHEQLYVAHNLLRADHDRLKTEYDDLRENLDRTTAQLDRIRAALGNIAPDDVASLANERQSLGEEVHRLRDEIHVLLAVQSERDQLAVERQQWLSELTMAHADRDLLTKKLAERDDQLATARTERDRSEGELENTAAEVERLRVALAESIEAAQNQRDRLGAELEAVHQEHDHLCAENAAARAERERLGAELEAIHHEHDRLRAEHAAAHDQRDRLGAELEAIHHEHDRLRAEHAAAHDQRDRLGAELEAIHHEHDRLRAEHAAAHDQRDRLGAELEAIRRALDLAEQSHRAELAQPTDQLTAVRENDRPPEARDDETLERHPNNDPLSFAPAFGPAKPRTGQPPALRVVSGENGARTNPSATATWTSGPEGSVAAGEIEDLRAQLVALGQKLEDSEARNREMVDALAGMGIRMGPVRG